MVRYLLNTSRSFIFSTAAPPPAMAGALAALELLQERPHRVERLSANARTLRRALACEGFAVAEGDMHIVPLVVGDAQDTLHLCQEAIERGVFAQAIRPPTVPAGTSRLRLAAMASHTATDMRMAAEVLAAAARKLGLDPAQLGTPLPEPEPAGQGEQDLEREVHEPLPVAKAASVPFDVEQPRPRRPPAPVQAESGDANAPFDGERESAVAHAA
jgi:glycine C-acetyltransferase/8-amino-7-oxononanoate synthase